MARFYCSRIINGQNTFRNALSGILLASLVFQNRALSDQPEATVTGDSNSTVQATTFCEVGAFEQMPAMWQNWAVALR